MGMSCSVVGPGAGGMLLISNKSSQKASQRRWHLSQEFQVEGMGKGHHSRCKKPPEQRLCTVLGSGKGGGRQRRTISRVGLGAGGLSRTLSQASTDENRKREEEKRGVQTGILVGPRATRTKQLIEQ